MNNKVVKKNIDILISDDHPFTLMGTKTFVESLGYNVCELCSNGINAFNMILHRKPRIALLDINMPGMNGVEILEKIGTQAPRTKIVLLTMHKETSIFNRAKELGVKGYLLKEFAMDVMEECLDEVSKGNTWFSPQLSDKLNIDQQNGNDNLLNALTFAEKKILQLIAQQETSKKIAEKLFISEKTIEKHRSNIMKKLDLPAEKNALLLWAVQNIK